MQHGSPSVQVASAIPPDPAPPHTPAHGLIPLSPLLPAPRDNDDNHNGRMALAMTSEAINGPSTDGGLPPFAWEGKYADIPRR